MYYPRFTKVIVNFFMTKDQSIPRRNTVNWHYARDDHMFTTIKLVSRHQNSQQYGVILPVELTNEAIRNSESYKEYYAIASGAEPLKTKASVRKEQSSSDTTVPLSTKGKRLKISAKMDKPAKEKQPAKSSTAKGLTMLSEVALTEAEQIKLATKRSLTKTYISHASGSGADEGTDIILGVLDLPNYESDDEKISWKSSEEDDDNNDDKEKISEHDDDVDDQSDDDQKDQDDHDDDEQTDSDNDGDDFVHPKFSTHDEEAKDEESFDPIVQTPSHDDKTDDEDNDEDSDGMNVEGDEGANEEDDADELYKDVNVNLEVRDIQMADVQTTQVIEDTHVTLTSVNPKDQQQNSSVSSRFVSNMLNPSPDTAHSPENVPSLSLQNLPNFGSLFGFGHRLKTLETNFSVFMQTNQFSEVVSLIPSIVDKYIDHQMNKAGKVVVRLQSDRLQNEAQVENEDFLNKLDENIQKIIKDQVKEQVKVQVSKILPKIKKTVNEQLEAEVLTSSSNSSKTSYVVAADLSELELKKILIKKMEQQPWISNMAKKADSCISFNELMDTFVDFSAFVMNRLKVDTLTPELLAGLTYELMKGSCKSLVELDFFLEEVYKATTNQLDWNNPEGQQYPHDLLKLLPLIPNS
nr:hypothetical protein [Tanacetum cinerariifolium]